MISYFPEFCAEVTKRIFTFLRKYFFIQAKNIQALQLEEDLFNIGFNFMESSDFFGQPIFIFFYFKNQQFLL